MLGPREFPNNPWFPNDTEHPCPYLSILSENQIVLFPQPTRELKELPMYISAEIISIRAFTPHILFPSLIFIPADFSCHYTTNKKGEIWTLQKSLR